MCFVDCDAELSDGARRSNTNLWPFAGMAIIKTSDSDTSCSASRTILGTNSCCNAPVERIVVCSFFETKSRVPPPEGDHRDTSLHPFFDSIEAVPKAIAPAACVVKRLHRKSDVVLSRHSGTLDKRIIAVCSSKKNSRKS